MKVYVYTVTIYPLYDISRIFEQKQIKIFIPEKGIFAFHKEKETYKGEEKVIVDFFTDNSEEMAKDKKFLDEIKHIEQNETGPQPFAKFIGEIHLPDALIDKTIDTAKKFQASKEKFETYAKALFSEAEIVNTTISVPESKS